MPLPIGKDGKGMGGFLLFLGLFCFVSGLVSLFKPLTALRINGRGTAAGVLTFGLFIALVGLGQLGGTTTPATSGFTPPAVSTVPSASSTPDRSANPELPTEPEPPPRPDLELIESHPEAGEFGAQMIAGTVKNNRSREYGYVQVEINLYDDAGNQLGSTLANCNNLEPGGTWKFQAPVIYENTASYRVKGVTGF